MKVIYCGRRQGSQALVDEVLVEDGRKLWYKAGRKRAFLTIGGEYEADIDENNTLKGSPKYLRRGENDADTLLEWETLDETAVILDRRRKDEKSDAKISQLDKDLEPIKRAYWKLNVSGRAAFELILLSRLRKP